MCSAKAACGFSEKLPASSFIYNNVDLNDFSRNLGVDRQKLKTIKAMIKKLLSASLFAFVALAANAYEIGEFAYTKVAKYEITGANLVVNGQFKDGDTGFASGWKSADATLPLESVFTLMQDGPNGSNTQKVIDGQTALNNGMYQKIAISAGGTYVVSFKVMGATASFTDLDLTGGNTNYMAAYYNTDEKDSLAIADGTNLIYGTNGVSGAYQFSFGTEGFTEAVFAVDAPAEGYIIIDFRGLNAGVEIADVECHLAEQVYDNRIADNRIAYFDKYLQSEGIEDRKLYDDFQEMVGVVKEGIESNAAPSQMEMYMQDMEGVWEEFVDANFENVLDFIVCIDGSTPSGNNSSNWMNWTNKYNKLKNEYPTNKAPWTWSTDRWCHKTAAANSPMSLQWMRSAGANDGWNNIATLTTTLRPGTYYWGVTGQGGMMTLNKNRWARSWADECADTYLFFNGDTVSVGILNAARDEDYVVEFKLEEEKEVTLGLICNNVSSSEKAGFDVNFINPVLYKLRVEGERTVEELAYLEAVQGQIDALIGRIEVANAYVSAANDTLPWGKEALKAGAEEAQARLDVWSALTEDEIIEKLYNDEKWADTIMIQGVRFLNNDYITPFEAMNKPLTDMPGAIAAAEEVLPVRMYSSSSKRTELEASIAASKAMYAEKLQVPFSTEDSLALINQRLDMAAMVEAFKAAIDTKTVIDINFDGATVETHEDPEQLVETYWTIAGAMGTMKLSSYANGTTGTTQFELGVNNTDSLNMLRIGNGEATVDIAGVPVTDQDIVCIKFDYFFGKFTGKDAGYKILTAEGDTIGGLFYCAYDGNVNADRGFDTYGIKSSVIPAIGSSGGNDNAKIAESGNKTTFEVILDYGLKTMYCVTTSSKGTFTSEAIAFNGAIPAQLVIYSSYTNADRRCWIDNILVQNIATDPNGIEAIQIAKPVANGIMYNIMGQQILKPIKGQIYIQNGVKKIGK